VRIRLAWALRQVLAGSDPPSADAEDLVLRLLVDGDPSVRAVAAEVAGQSSSRLVEAALLRAAEDEVDEVAVEALRSLGRRGVDPETIWADGSRDLTDSEWERLLLALTSFGEPQGVRLAQLALTQAPARLRPLALRLILLSAEPEALYVARQLVRVSPTGAARDGAALELRRLALRVLAIQGHPLDREILVAAVQRCEAPGARGGGTLVEALEALAVWRPRGGSLGGAHESVKQCLLRILGSDRSDREQMAAAHLAARLAYEPEVVQLLLRTARSTATGAVRAAAAGAVFVLGAPESSGLLAELAADRDVVVRSAATCWLISGWPQTLHGWPGQGALRPEDCYGWDGVAPRFGEAEAAAHPETAAARRRPVAGKPGFDLRRARIEVDEALAAGIVLASRGRPPGPALHIVTSRGQLHVELRCASMLRWCGALLRHVRRGFFDGQLLLESPGVPGALFFSVPLAESLTEIPLPYSRSFVRAADSARSPTGNPAFLGLATASGDLFLSRPDAVLGSVAGDPVLPRLLVAGDRVSSVTVLSAGDPRPLCIGVSEMGRGERPAGRNQELRDAEAGVL
jgi:hypothetical protein